MELETIALIVKEAKEIAENSTAFDNDFLKRVLTGEETFEGYGREVAVLSQLLAKCALEIRAQQILFPSNSLN